jgi:hypothetical protein
MITVYDRYSDKTWNINEHTLFILGNNILTIRKSNNECVDLRDSKGKVINWWCLEYVLKHPNKFKPIIICEDIGKYIKHPLLYCKTKINYAK